MLCYNINLVVEIFTSILIPIRCKSIHSFHLHPSFHFCVSIPPPISSMITILVQYKPFCLIESVIRHISFIDLISFHPFYGQPYICDQFLFINNFHLFTINIEETIWLLCSFDNLLICNQDPNTFIHLEIRVLKIESYIMQSEAIIK